MIREAAMSRVSLSSSVSEVHTSRRPARCSHGHLAILGRGVTWGRARLALASQAAPAAKVGNCTCREGTCRVWGRSAARFLRTGAAKSTRARVCLASSSARRSSSNPVPYLLTYKYTRIHSITMYPARRRSMLYEGMHRTIIYKALFVRTSALFSLSLLSIRSSRLPAPHLP